MTNNCSHLSSLILYKLQLKENMLNFSKIFSLKKPTFLYTITVFETQFFHPFLLSFHGFKPLMVLHLKII